MPTKSRRVYLRSNYAVQSERYKSTNTYSNTPQALGPYNASVTSGVNPDWRKQIARGQCATTGLSGDDLKLVKLTRGAWSHQDLIIEPWTTAGTTTHIWGDGVGPGSHFGIPDAPSSISTLEANNQAKMAFLKKALALQRAFQGGVALGELRETLHMIKGRSLTFYRGIGEYATKAKKLRRRPATIKDKEKALANLWLEYAFGWAPLLNDVSDAGRALNRMDYWEIPRKRIRARGQSKALDSYQVQTLNHNNVQFRLEYRKDSLAQVQYVGQVQSRAMNPVHYQARLFGVSLRDFVPTVWELVPWSFLVDYFTNVQEILEGWSFQRSGLAWTQVTFRQIRGYEAYSIPVNTLVTGWVMTSKSPTVSRVERKLVSRSVYTGSFTPDLVFQIPGIGNARKYLNIAALARVVLGK